MINHFHLLSSLLLDAKGYHLFCRCTLAQFENLVDIICEGDTPFACSFEVLQQDTEEVHYRVDLPANLPEERHHFTAVNSTGEKKAVWRPDDTLDPESLPPGFFFQQTYLNLTYSHQKTIDQQAYDPTNCHGILTGISRKESTLLFSGFIFLPLHTSHFEDIKLYISRFRDEKTQYIYPVEIIPITENILGLYEPQHFERYSGNSVFKIRCTVDMEEIKEIDGYFSILFKHDHFKFTPKNYAASLSSKDHIFSLRLSFSKMALIVPHYNEFINCWRLDIYHLNFLDWLRLKILRRQCRKTPVKKNPNIWLLGEYGSTARDNGMHFYNYLCQQKKKDITAYYVIYKDSKQRQFLNKKNIVFFGSYKHFTLSAQAGVLVFTHLPEALLAKDLNIVRHQNKLQRFTTVFLQHGVIALKSDIQFYSRKARNYDLFVASSAMEKKIINNFFGYDKNNIIITGLARWDRLFTAANKVTDSDKTILLAPTWRFEFEQFDEKKFQSSSFYKFWSTLLTNPELLNALKRNNTRIQILAHIGFQHFRHLFEQSDVVELADTDNIGKMIEQSKMMVTDYSSIAFDMLFQNKPVIFCTFDLDHRVERGQEQFIDMDKELPGPYCPDLQSVVQEIIDHIENDFSIKEMYQQRRSQFFAHIDSNNCQRIFQEITHHLSNNR